MSPAQQNSVNSSHQFIGIYFGDKLRRARLQCISDYLRITVSRKEQDSRITNGGADMAGGIDPIQCFQAETQYDEVGP